MPAAHGRDTLTSVTLPSRSQCTKPTRDMSDDKKFQLHTVPPDANDTVVLQVDEHDANVGAFVSFELTNEPPGARLREFDTRPPIENAPFMSILAGIAEKCCRGYGQNEAGYTVRCWCSPTSSGLCQRSRRWNHARKNGYQHELTHAQRLEAGAVGQQVNPGRSYDAQ